MIWGNSSSRTKSWNCWFPDCRTLILRTGDTTPPRLAKEVWSVLVDIGVIYLSIYLYILYIYIYYIQLYIIIHNYICNYIYIYCFDSCDCLSDLLLLLVLYPCLLVVHHLGCLALLSYLPIVPLFARFYTHWISVEFSVVVSNTLCMPYMLGKYWFVMVGLACIKHGGCLWFVSN